MKEAKKSPTKREQYRQRLLEAMPDVKEVVRKHGIALVNSCIIKLREIDKNSRKVQELREKADELEREISGNPAKLRAAG